MKKILTLVIAVAMILTLSVNVFANEENVGGTNGLETLNQPSDIDVTVGITTGTPTTVYRVDVAWENTDFTYYAEYSNSWDPTSHSYKSSSGDTWSHKVATITVTNHSNAAVDVKAVATAGAAGVNYTFSNGDKLLESAAAATRIDTFANADSTSYTLTIEDNAIPAQAGSVAVIDITLS